MHPRTVGLPSDGIRGPVQSFTLRLRLVAYLVLVFQSINHSDYVQSVFTTDNVGHIPHHCAISLFLSFFLFHCVIASMCRNPGKGSWSTDELQVNDRSSHSNSHYNHLRGRGCLFRHLLPGVTSSTFEGTVKGMEDTTTTATTRSDTSGGGGGN